MGLLGRYKHAPNPRIQSPRRLQRLTEHCRTASHLGPSELPICLPVFVPLTAILQGSVLKKRTFFWRFCGFRNASERRTFCCAVHQKRDFKAHPTASTALLVGSFQLAADSRLSTFDSQLFHSRPRLPLGSRNLRSGYRSCGQRGLEFDCGLEKGLFDGRNHPMSLHRL